VATQYQVRPVRADEWNEIKALRLVALSDEVAPLAFLESHAEAAARPDAFWQERARASSVDAGPNAGARQFVAVTVDGTWVGTAVALVERAGDRDFADSIIETSGGHLVGVYLHPDHRGRGVLGDLVAAATGWLHDLGLDRVRLYCHEDNGRARRAYEKAGFAPTGARVTSVVGPEIEMAMTL